MSPKILIKDQKTINRKRDISDQVGNTSNKLYHNILQAGIPLDKNNCVQGEVELLSCLNCTSVQPKVQTGGTIDKEIQSDNSISGYCQHVLIHKSRNNQKSGDIFSIKLIIKTKNTINLCLELIRFGMSSTFYFLQHKALQISRQIKGRTRASTRSIKSGVTHQPGCLLPV